MSTSSFTPVRVTARSPRMARACRVITGIWLGATAVQFVVWLLGCVIGLTFVAPFWLWSAFVGGAVVAALRWTVAVDGRDGR
ncbi:hypothetical protein [Amycolatopsis minnesotensis]|uniref:DUF2530 domain-containing protein n=1 Tax=Amycolatopsis minnesotensis TaxID=337894 RepID=A0ABP5E5M3_9PSEU